MGRKQKHKTGPLVSISVDGLGGSWCYGIFAGDPRIQDMARLAVKMKLTYYFRNCLVTADDTTPLGALAALAAWSPGRTDIKKAPDSVFAHLAAGMTHV